jgi:hypothetical protein
MNKRSEIEAEIEIVASVGQFSGEIMLAGSVVFWRKKPDKGKEQ